jgi:hypothetical protein
MLTRLIYHSENRLVEGHPTAELNAILAVSNLHNQRDGITGALMFDAHWFIQILEGERERVSATLGRLFADPRHAAVTVIDVQPVENRMFGDWWMGGANLQGENDVLLARHRLGPQLDPRKMSGRHAVALALDIAKNGLLDRHVADAA